MIRAHHEKLCLVDGQTAFMGGLDLCYGRWDTYQHSIADAHPGNLDDIVFPGQDYNNARIMDFQDVAHWENNKLDRRVSSRMGWSDLSISIIGPVVEDLRAHFVQRWNFIYREKYDVRKDTRYCLLSTDDGVTYLSSNTTAGYSPVPSHFQGQSYPSQQRYQAPSYDNSNQGVEPDHHHHHHMERLEQEMMQDKQEVKERLGGKIHRLHDQYLRPSTGGSSASRPRGPMFVQLVRSATKWSNGSASVPPEHSIQNAYIDIISNSQHFLYIENQFFITATGNQQRPVVNTIGAAIVERICRAASSGQKFKVIVVIPCVPAFAGDLRDDSSLGTRAIMEYQYNSICRGGHRYVPHYGM